jgi:hypothetical protein
LRFARIVFRIAGVYGFVVLFPQYFMEQQLGRDYPPPINHPEHFYGFVGVALVWQLAYLLISTDPVRYRPFMILAVLAKASFGIAVYVLFFQNRAPGLVLGFATVDLLLGALFLVAWLRLR